MRHNIPALFPISWCLLAMSLERASADPSQDMYCGSSWLDASQNCHEPCPSGEDGDCSRDGWSCFLFTGCASREADHREVDEFEIESTRNSGQAKEDEEEGIGSSRSSSSNGSSSNNSNRLEESFRYCGSTWLDATLTCSSPCPGGDGDCPDGYSCFAVANCIAHDSETSNGNEIGSNVNEDSIETLESEVIMSLLGIEQLMGSVETGLLEETVLDFLAEAMTESHIDVTNAKVSRQQTSIIAPAADENNAKNRRRQRRLPTSSSALEVNLVITGEYRPPPYLDMDAIVSDSINRESSAIVKDLRERGAGRGQGGVATTDFFDGLRDVTAASARETTTSTTTTRSPTTSAPVPGPTASPSQRPSASLPPTVPPEEEEATTEDDADDDQPWQSEEFAANDSDSDNNSDGDGDIENGNSLQEAEDEETKGGRHDKFSTASGIAVYTLDDETSDPDGHPEDVAVEEETAVGEEEEAEESANEESLDEIEAGSVHSNETVAASPIPSKEQENDSNVSDGGTTNQKNGDGNNDQERDQDVDVDRDSTESIDVSNSESSNDSSNKDTNQDSQDGNLLETNFILTLQNVPEVNMNERETIKYQQILKDFLLRQRELSKSEVEVLDVRVRHQILSSTKKEREAEKIMNEGKIKTNAVSSTKKYRAKSRNLKVLAERVSYNGEDSTSASSTREDIDITTTIRSSNPNLPPYVASILILNRIAALNATILHDFRSEDFYSYFKNIQGIAVRLIDHVTAEPTFAPTAYDHFLSLQEVMDDGAGGNAQSRANIYVATGLGIAAMWCLLTTVSLLHLRRARNEMRNERTLRSSRKIMEDDIVAGKGDQWGGLDGSEMTNITKSTSFVSEVTDAEYEYGRHIHSDQQHDVESGIMTNGPSGVGGTDIVAIPECGEKNQQPCPTHVGRSNRLSLLLDMKIHAKSQRLLQVQNYPDSGSGSDSSVDEVKNADPTLDLSTALLPPQSTVTSSHAMTSPSRVPTSNGPGGVHGNGLDIEQGHTSALTSVERTISKHEEACLADTQSPDGSGGQSVSRSRRRSTVPRPLTTPQDRLCALSSQTKSCRASKTNHSPSATPGRESNGKSHTPKRQARRAESCRSFATSRVPQHAVPTRVSSSLNLTASSRDDPSDDDICHRPATATRNLQADETEPAEESEKIFISISNGSGSSGGNSKKTGRGRLRSCDFTDSRRQPRRKNHRSSDSSHNSREMKNHVRKPLSSRSRSLKRDSHRIEPTRTSSSLNSKRRSASALLDDNIFLSLVGNTSIDNESGKNLVKHRKAKSHSFTKNEAATGNSNTTRRMRSYSDDLSDDEHRRRRKNRALDSSLASRRSHLGKMGQNHIRRSASHRNIL